MMPFSLPASCRFTAVGLLPAGAKTERLKRNRTVVRAHAVTITPRPPLALRGSLPLLPLRRFLRQIPQMFCTFAQIVHAHQMAYPPHQTCRREIVLPAVVLRFERAPIPGRNMLRPKRVVGLCPGTARCHPRFSGAAGEPENLKWNENKICERRAGFGRLRRRGSDGEIKRTGVRWLPAVAKDCLHIGFCEFSRRQNSAVQSVQVPPYRLSP
jgi:hypothetical protein